LLPVTQGVNHGQRALSIMKRRKTLSARLYVVPTFA
jgi:hypothetical protein